VLKKVTSHPHHLNAPQDFFHRIVSKIKMGGIWTCCDYDDDAGAGMSYHRHNSSTSTTTNVENKKKSLIRLLEVGHRWETAASLKRWCDWPDVTVDEVDQLLINLVCAGSVSARTEMSGKCYEYLLKEYTAVSGSEQDSALLVV